MQYSPMHLFLAQGEHQNQNMGERHVKENWKYCKRCSLMTGTQVEIEFVRGVNSLMPNSCLNHVMQCNMEEIGLPEYDENDWKTAENL